MLFRKNVGYFLFLFLSLSLDKIDFARFYFQNNSYWTYFQSFIHTLPSHIFPSASQIQASKLPPSTNTIKKVTNFRTPSPICSLLETQPVPIIRGGSDRLFEKAHRIFAIIEKRRRRGERIHSCQSYLLPHHVLSRTYPTENDPSRRDHDNIRLDDGRG